VKTEFPDKWWTINFWKEAVNNPENDGKTKLEELHNRPWGLMLDTEEQNLGLLPGL
jgi:hypothetical protein